MVWGIKPLSLCSPFYLLQLCGLCPTRATLDEPKLGPGPLKPIDYMIPRWALKARFKPNYLGPNYADPTRRHAL